MGHQMVGSRIAMVKNGELPSVAQQGSGIMKTGRKMSQGK